MADIYELADQQREAVLSRDGAASSGLVRSYSRATKSLREEIDGLVKKIEDARASGKPIRPSWLDSEGRLKSIERQLNEAISRYAHQASGIIEDDIKDSTGLGASHASAMLEEQLGPRVNFRQLNEAALQSISQFTNRGALRDLLDGMGPDLSKRVRELLTAAIVTGRHPETTARMIRSATGEPLSRSVTIARTEAMRAYREATHRSYLDNSDVISGWYWYSGLGTNTCAACWAMHGVFHKVEDRLSGHPRCRCVQVPFTKTWEELGLSGVPESRPKAPEPGASRFLRLPEADQMRILGPGAYAALKAGEIRLRSMATMHDDPRWGQSIRRSSLQQAKDATGSRTPRVRPTPKSRTPVDSTPKVDPGSGADVRQKVIDFVDKEHAKLIAKADAKVQGLHAKIYTLDVETDRLHSLTREAADRMYEAGISDDEWRRRAKIYDDLQDRQRAHEAEVEKTWKQVRKAGDDRYTLETKADEVVRKKYIEQKTKSNAMIDIDTISNSKPTPDERKAWQKGIDAWRRMAGAGHEVDHNGATLRIQSVRADPFGRNADLDRRSYHRSGYGVFMAEGVRSPAYGELYSTHATVVHEITHWWEDRDDYLNRHIKDYYAKRTAGESLVKLKDHIPNSGYADSEMARPDKFVDAYMGKDYGHPRSHELFTMAIQRMYATPIEFAQQDPDMFEWTIDVLRRRLP